MSEIIEKDYNFDLIIPSIPGFTEKMKFNGKDFNSVKESDIQVISAGFGHTLILMNGDMYGCGDNSAKQLSNENTEMFLNFILLPRGEIDDDEKIISVKAGGNFSVALIETGEIFIWGTVSSRLPTFLYPTMIAIPEEIRITEIDCGNFHFIAGASDGSVYTWNENQLTNLDLPESIQVCAKDNRSGSLGTDGVIYIWGEGIEGIEEINKIDEENPVVVTGIVFGNKELFIISEKAIHIFNIETGDFTRRNSSRPLVSVTAGDDFFIYLIENKKGLSFLVSRGDNRYGNLGTGEDLDFASDDEEDYFVVNIGSNTIKQVSGKYLHCIAVDSEGKIFTWGYGERGQLGTGNDNIQNLPVQVYLPEKNFSKE